MALKPSDSDPLTADDLALAAEAEAEIDAWLKSHDEYNVNTIAQRKPLPRRIWEELGRRYSEAGWDASLRGAVFLIKKF